MNEIDRLKKRAAEYRLLELKDGLGNDVQGGKRDIDVLWDEFKQLRVDYGEALKLLSQNGHCSCFWRIQQVRTDNEFAITPANIEHERFHEVIGNKLLEVVCTTCGTKFYVGKLSDLAAIYRTPGMSDEQYDPRDDNSPGVW